MVGHPSGRPQGRPQQDPPLTDPSPEQVRLLLSDAGRAAVALAGRQDLAPGARIAAAEVLRAAAGPVLGPLALEQALLKRHARAKHPRGEELWWTREALEQASSHLVAGHRAQRYAAGALDLCCSVGGDLLALAARGGAVGVDTSEPRLLLAAENARVLGVPVALVRADVTTLPLPPDAQVFVDPARRAGGRRVFDPAAYAPALAEVLSWRVRALGAKVAPGLDWALVPPGVEGEVVSLRGEVKEAVLWAGEARSGALRTATLLPGGHTLAGTGAPAPQVRPPGAFLMEPDGAVVRAQLVAEAAVLVDGWLLDATIAYVAAEAPVATPYGTWFQVLEVLPFGLKALRERLRAHDAGPLVVKKRGTAVEPDELRRRLRLTGSREVTVVLTRNAGRQVAMIVHRL